MAKAAWQPPPDPDLEELAKTGWRQWELDRPSVIAFDTETEGLEYHDPAFCLTLAWHSDDVIQGPGVYGHYFELALPGVEEALRTIFRHAKVVVAHNWKFDAHKLDLAGIVTDWSPYEIHDTEAMAHLDNEHRDKGLKDLAVSVLGEDDTIYVPARAKDPATGEMREYEKPVPRQKWEIDQARAWAKKKYGLASVKDVGYHLLPRGTVVPYAIADAEWTLRLAQVLHPRILKHDDLTRLYHQEMRLSRTAMFSLEKAGMAVGREYVAKQVKVYRKKVLKHEADIERIVGKPVRTGKIPAKERDEYFNPASNPEIAALFTAAGYPAESYDEENLNKIPHPMAAKLLAYRADKKLLDGYFIALARETGADGIFHPSLRQHGTVTGRTSAGAERGDY